MNVSPCKHIKCLISVFVSDHYANKVSGEISNNLITQKNDISENHLLKVM